jgi:hypothetical protein
MLVSVVILAVLVLFVARLFNSAAAVTTSGSKHIDADTQARQLLDRMTIDFAQIVKRGDVDYYLKSPANAQSGNDQIAFYSSVPGYYPSTGSPSPISLVAFRINAQKLERLGKGLVWNGVSATNKPIVFLPLTISATWPAATSMTADNDYEAIGPQVFRFEYYYQLKNGNLSDTPWDAGAGHIDPSGLQDVIAVNALIAVVDPKSKVLLSNSQIDTLVTNMNDFASSMRHGDLAAQWQSVLDSTTDMPRASLSSVRIYERAFPVIEQH